MQLDLELSFKLVSNRSIAGGVGYRGQGAEMSAWGHAV